MTRRSESIIIRLSATILARLIQIYALYVVFHGHYSPGGGFQGGALLAASIILLRMSEGGEVSQSAFRSTLGTPLGAVGAMIYAGVGAFAIVQGGAYLNYGVLPLPMASTAEVRSLGILIIEMGVALAVMATLVSIFDDLAQEGPDA